MREQDWRDQLERMLRILQGHHTLRWNEELPSTLLLGFLGLIACYTFLEVVFRNSIWGVNSAWQLIVVCLVVITIISALLYHKYTSAYIFDTEQVRFCSPFPFLNWQLKYSAIEGCAVEWNKGAITAFMFEYQYRKARIIPCTQSMRIIMEPFRDAYRP